MGIHGLSARICVPALISLMAQLSWVVQVLAARFDVDKAKTEVQESLMTDSPGC